MIIGMILGLIVYSLTMLVIIGYEEWLNDRLVTNSNIFSYNNGFFRKWYRMTNEFIDELGSYLDRIDDFIYKDTKNSIEKINIITKIEELIFWLEQYRSQHIEGE